MYLCSYLRSKRKGKDLLRILDMRCYGKHSEQMLSDEIKAFKPDIIAVSSLTVERQQLHNVANIAKVLQPHVIVIVGGPHATAYPQETLSNVNIDYIIMGEGEETFTTLIEHIENKDDMHSIPAIGFRIDKKVYLVSRPNDHLALNQLPFPAWDLIDREVYFGLRSMAAVGLRRYMCISTSRGCPYKCIFCHNINGKKWRARSIDNIIEEIENLQNNYQINEFEIIDDCFNLEYKRTVDFFKRIIDKNLKIKIQFPNGLRADLLDESIIKLMKRAGVNYMAFAVESASTRLQKKINKNIDLQRVNSMIDYAFRSRIYVSGFFMMGFPEETKREVLMTISFAVKSRLSQALFFFAVPYGNTELFKYYKENKTFSDKKERDLFNEHYFKSKVNLSRVPDRLLFCLNKYAYIRFYFSIRRLIYFFRCHPSRNDRRFILRILKRVLVQCFT